MSIITVKTSKSYDVMIGTRLLEDITSVIQKVTTAQAVCIVSDDHVWPLYREAVCRTLERAEIAFCHFIFPAGENSKNGDTYLKLLHFLAENNLTRSDCIIALGGGVVGDLAGFAAATYLRGIPYIQVPTSLLAMVDSSVGGKTGIDLDAGKNLCGAFYQPAAVICDTDVLSTLPEDVFRDGCAEVIKYAVLFDPELFRLMEQTGLDFDQEAVITRCVEHKRNVVVGDEFDRGQRMLLNLGHTIGHAIETCSDYTISHGKAVAIGMAMVCRAAKCPDADRISALLEKFGLPTTTNLPAKALWEAALSDKKRSAQMVNLIIPNAIGDCSVIPTAIEKLKTFIEEGM
jgi:3-dehydroquinate synthase